MGRARSAVGLSQNIREEVELAQAVAQAAGRLLAEQRSDTGDAETARLIQRTLAELAGTGAQALESAGGAVPRVVFLDALEIVQEVQNIVHSVPLVAGKTTIVRAYLRYAPQPVEVRGELSVARSPFGPWQTVLSIGPALLDPSRSGASPAQLGSRRANLDFSLNFRLPDNVTQAGPVWLRMGPIRRSTGTPLPSVAMLPIRTVTFRSAAVLRLRLVRLPYTMGTPPVTHEPSATDVALIRSWLRRAYPIAQLDLTITTVSATPTPPFIADQINAQLTALRAVDVATGTDVRTHYYGMVADSGFFMRGKASDIPQTPRPETVASGPTGSDTFGWDSDGSYGDWYGGHELGHTFGRFHAEFCGAVGGAPYPFPNGQLSDSDEAFVGIDVGDASIGLPMRILGGTDSHDVMSYCDDQWLSSFTYSGVYNRLIAENALSPGSAGLGAPGGSEGFGEERTPGLRVIAALNLSQRSGTITAILPAGAAVDAPERAMESQGTTLRVRSGDGDVLDERPALFQRGACEDPGDDVTGIVDTIIPSNEAAATIELLIDGLVVDRHPVGGEPAPLGALAHSQRAAAGLGGPPGGTLELRWEGAPDAPAGQRYIVQISDDAGDSWRTIAVGLTEPAVTLTIDDLEADEVIVRVLATTGTGATVMRTETVPLRS